MSDAYHLALQAVTLFILGYGVAMLAWTARQITRR